MILSEEDGTTEQNAIRYLKEAFENICNGSYVILVIYWKDNTSKGIADIVWHHCYNKWDVY